jgi:hypothetical protein
MLLLNHYKTNTRYKLIFKLWIIYIYNIWQISKGIYKGVNITNIRH